MLTMQEAANCAGITKKQIQKWIERRLIDMPHVRTRSQGIPAQFSDYDILYLALVGSFIEFGAPVKDAAKMADKLFRDAKVTRASKDLLTPFKGTTIKVTGWQNPRTHVLLAIDADGLFKEVLGRANALREQQHRHRQHGAA